MTGEGTRPPRPSGLLTSEASPGPTPPRGSLRSRSNGLVAP
jgi:hypothetical protein